MKLSTKLDPEEDPVPRKPLPGITGVQQKLPKLKHDTGKSAAGSVVLVLRTPYTLFRSILQLIFNIEILIRYKYDRNVHDMNAVHKYVEYLMLAIRKDVSFYTENQKNVLSQLKEYPEEVKQINETFQELLKKVELLYSEKTSTLPDSLDDYDIDCLKDDMELNLPSHPLMDDEQYLDRDQDLDFECEYFHILIFAFVFKIAARYYAIAQYALTGNSNIAFSRAANIEQIKRSLYSVVDLCVPFYNILNIPEFEVREYEACRYLFQSDYKIKGIPDRYMALAIELKVCNKQCNLNEFLKILNNCPFFLRISAETYIPKLCGKWLRLNYAGLSPIERDLYSFATKSLTFFSLKKENIFKHINLDLDFKKTVHFLDLIVRDQVLFCKSDSRSSYLSALRRLQDKQLKEFKEMNKITFDKEKKEEATVYLTYDVNWKNVPFTPQITNTFYSHSNYVNTNLRDIEFDLANLLFDGAINLNSKTFIVKWTGNPNGATYTKKSNPKSVKKSSTILASLLKSKKEISPIKQDKFKSVPQQQIISAKPSSTESEFEGSDKISEVSDVALIESSSPFAKVQTPITTKLDGAFSFLPFSNQKPSSKLKTEIEVYSPDIDMEDALSPVDSSAIKVHNPPTDRPRLAVTAPKTLFKFDIAKNPSDFSSTQRSSKVPKNDSVGNTFNFSFKSKIADQSVAFKLPEIRPSTNEETTTLKFNTTNSSLQPNIANLAKDASKDIKLKYNGQPNSFIIDSEIRVQKHHKNIIVDARKVFAPNNPINSHRTDFLNMNKQKENGHLPQRQSTPTNSVLSTDSVFSIKPEYDVFVPFKKRRPKAPSPISSKRPKFDVKSLIQQSNNFASEYDDLMDFQPGLDRLLEECEKDILNTKSLFH
eukprot:NODE_79_length_23048_cov_0.747614.p2 type:complete len:880 gc:universal NODE_79_length_23048_cov_0.747614:20099-22738(+)